MLYSDQDKSWKIADFGLTTEGTSRGFITTTFSRGTTGYRALELMNDERHYNNKSDIWSLGCILYELVTETKRFPTDYSLIVYSVRGENNGTLQANGLFDESWREWVEDDIENMLEIEPLHRPSARRLFETFSFHHDLLCADGTKAGVKSGGTGPENNEPGSIPSRTPQFPLNTAPNGKEANAVLGSNRIGTFRAGKLIFSGLTEATQTTPLSGISTHADQFKVPVMLTYRGKGRSQQGLGAPRNTFLHWTKSTESVGTPSRPEVAPKHIKISLTKQF